MVVMIFITPASRARLLCSEMDTCLKVEIIMPHVYYGGRFLVGVFFDYNSFAKVVYIKAIKIWSDLPNVVHRCMQVCHLLAEKCFLHKTLQFSLLCAGTPSLSLSHGFWFVTVSP